MVKALLQFGISPIVVGLLICFFAFGAVVSGCGDSETLTNQVENAHQNQNQNQNQNNDTNQNNANQNDNQKNNQNQKNNENNGENNSANNNGENPSDSCDPEDVIPRPVADADDDPCRPDDGWDSAAVFVATHGDDANLGTLTDPLQTIQAGLDLADSEENLQFVLVESGTYPESIELRDGIQLIATYEVGWAYHPSNRATVEEGNPTLFGEGIESPTRIRNLRVDPLTDAEEQETVVTAYLYDSDGVIFENVQIFGGRAGDGPNGADGDDGSDGERGDDGETGDRTGSLLICNTDDPGTVGAGGTNICSGTSGGDGGAGGRGDDSGAGGQASEGGASGGSSGGEEEDGGDGADGASGENGAHGVGGTADGHFDGLQWVGEDGTDGARGEDGIGGGGGGGAGGEDTFGTCDHWGGSGGGGGSGGCGGQGGTAGGYGGASIALFLENSDIEIRQSRIEGGTGGDGGHGGTRGDGGTRGLGGNGGSSSGDGGTGGDGGNGGDGGDGGHGGGGAGGPAFAIFSTDELSTDLEDSLIEEGNAGRGGGPSSEPTEAADGLAGDIQIGL